MTFRHRDKSKRMSKGHRGSVLSLSILGLLFMAFGCASPTHRAHPEFVMGAKNIEAPVLMLPDVKMYEFSSGGVIELRDDWSATGKENVRKAVLKGFEDKKYNVKSLTTDGDIKEEIKEIQALYRAVNKSIQLHTYGPQLFPDKKKFFDYSLGSIKNILKDAQIDSVIFVSGFDHVTANGRSAFVSVGIADSSGTIVWYGGKGSKGGHDFRDPESTARLVGDILFPLPEAGQ